MFFYLITISLLLSCHKQSHETEKIRDSRFYAAAKEELQQTASFFYQVSQQEFKTNLLDLPLAGGVAPEKIPYTGFWYPDRSGGTGIRIRGYSALEKYDQAFHQEKPHLATDWEKKNHTVNPTSPHAKWVGHCNGFAAASQRHAQPMKAVKRNNVTFEPHDIKALLAEIYLNSKYFFLGGNRCGEASPETHPDRRKDPKVMGACEDLNPATFHTVVSNWLGRFGHVVILDTTINAQVWNYPHYRYAGTKKEISAAEALQVVSARAGSSYVFNPEAKRFFLMNTSVFFANAVEFEPLDLTQRYTQERGNTYDYVLETQEDGKILGGEWIKASQENHPDFIWLALETQPADGSSTSANPHVQAKTVLSMWAESIGADPQNPPSDLREPDWNQSWGKFPHWELTLDGAKNGVIFLGKPVKFKLTLKGPEISAKELSLFLDGLPLSADKKEDGTLQGTIDTIPGFHSLSMNSSKATVSSENAFFWATP